MADLSYTGDVIAQPSASVRDEEAGATIISGQAVYQETDGEYGLADHTTAAKSRCAGLAVNDALADGHMRIVYDGLVTFPGTPLTVGMAYFLSGTAGALCPYADLGTGDYVTYIGTAISTSVLDVAIHVSGVAKP